MSSLIILSPTAHRTTVKVTPNKILQEILEEACLKQGLVPENYKLVYQKKVIDLSLPFRLSGLSNGTTLNLQYFVSSSDNFQCTIALQGPSGSREQKVLSNTLTLLEVLENFSVELTSEEKHPVVMFMNKNFIGVEELKSKTLKSIGIKNDRVLIKYDFRVLSEEEKLELKKRLNEETKQRKKMEEIFLLKKKENEERELLKVKMEQESKLRNEFYEAKNRQREIELEKLKKEYLEELKKEELKSEELKNEE
ncbi:UBX domain containing protein TUG/UBX4 family-containing protein [Strongyloides ratti]|uniref:UBX domain containing protein TUG/UBX4 family-containing protein n=1 Tax=Strongyloides ratti TaxID=34506 RepID=A0A090MWU7_STRRB|nr:UBX domain containing protein TUG/UBX4 family-containing protein [Strongyloides ratti]CEF64304.1 UBX domain containing protein TUG/UBX4 family-containing protein [Strongyloides ratti]